MTTHTDIAENTGRITVISGGVGAARFLKALISAVDADRIDAVVNTGDDTVLHGLSISPDLDTVTYTLANAIDPERGWGLVDETWTAMAALERYESVRPDGSAAAPRWFGLGDQDLATHFYRTARLAEGATLTEVTSEIRHAWNVPIRLMPMTNDQCSTMVTLADGGEEISFQDYFVRLRHSVAVASIRFDGSARLSLEAHRSIESAATVVIAPSNPLVSIGPMRSLPGVDELLASRRSDCAAISPIVGGAALKGPADRMLTELGHEPTVVGVARLYAPIASVLVIDPADEALADAVEAEGMRCIVQPSIMSDPTVARNLAVATLGSVGAG